jgi:hypothetical protein
MSRPRSPHAQSIGNRHGAAYAAKVANTDDAPGMRYRVELNEGPMTWKHIASAPSLAVAKKTAEAKGGLVRAVEIRTGKVAWQWMEGVKHDG